MFVFLGMEVGRVAVFCVYVFFVKKKKKRNSVTTITSTIRTVEH